MRWQYLCSTPPATLEELEAILVSNRQLAADQLAGFFQPRHPAELSLEEVNINPDQVKIAIDRIFQAIINQESIIVFGDYDADGVCSTTVLWETLYGLGAQVKPFIPHREEHGYGMTDRSLSALLATEQPNLVITVDNGIVAQAAVSALQAQNIDVIITDHHQPEFDAQQQPILPSATAVVHSTKLCGTTVAWFLARELMSTARQAQLPQRTSDMNPNYWLDVCALATVADQMQLRHANRSFVVHGLKALQKTQRPGLLALYEIAGIKAAEISAGTINFGLAPRLNAMGRLAHSLDSVRLLCTRKPAQAQELASMLQATNVKRQDLTSDMFEHAVSLADEISTEHVLVVASPSYHEGVIGLIAGRLVEKYQRPAIAIAVGEKLAKASARSVPGVNIVELIRLVRDDLLEVGGHPMAAGFGLLPEKVELVQNRLFSLAKANILAEALEPTLELECALPWELLTEKTVTTLDKFAPFGQGNPAPVFAIENVTVMGAQAIGRDATHLRLVVAPEGEVSPLVILGWHQAEWLTQLVVGTRLDVAGQLELNHWNGRSSVQLVMKSLKIHS